MYDEDRGELFVGARSRDIWVRGLLTLLFLAVLWFIRLIVLILAVFQFVHAVVTGGPNRRLLPFARSVATYIRQLAAFVTWTTEMRPWPWSPWPSDDTAGDPATETSSAARDDWDEPFEPDVAYAPPPPEPVVDDAPPEPAEDTTPDADIAPEDSAAEEPPAAPKPKPRGGKGKKKKKNPHAKASDDLDPADDENPAV